MPFGRVPLDGGFLPLYRAIAAAAAAFAACGHVLVDGHRLPARDDVLHALDRVVLPPQRDGLEALRLQRRDDGVLRCRRSRPTTPWMLLLVWTSICSKIVWALAESQSGTNLAGPFLSLLAPEERVQDDVVAALEPERVRVGRAAPELRDRAVRVVRPVLLHAAENAERLPATHVGPVERDVDGAGAADDLAVVVDRLAAHGGELLLDRDRGAAVEIGDDADLRARPDALVGLCDLLLRLTQRVHDRRRHASPS